MKKLDEVIDYCEGKQTCGEWVGIADVLHYLKEYRDYQLGIIKLGNDMEEAISKEFDDNSALTWDELKGMKGKPVWVEWIFGICKGQRKWVLINKVKDDVLRFISFDIAGVSYYGYLIPSDLGKTCNIYRKEKA